VSEGEAVLRTTLRVCLLVGSASVLALGLGGHLDAGLALAIGIGIGSTNGYLAKHTLGLNMSFWITSLGRLTMLSAAGLAVALLLDPSFAWLVLVGIAAAQMMMAGVALKQGLRA
jgi:hypothetical protein